MGENDGSSIRNGKNSKLALELQMSTDRHVGGEAGDQRGGDGVRDGGVWVFRLLSRRRDDVEADEGVEASRCTLHHLISSNTSFTLFPVNVGI